MVTTGDLSGNEVPRRLPIGSNNPVQRQNRTLLDFIKKFEDKKKKKKKKPNLKVDFILYHGT